MRKKIYIGVFIFVAINIVVACAEMNDEGSLLKDVSKNSQSSQSSQGSQSSDSSLSETFGLSNKDSDFEYSPVMRSSSLSISNRGILRDFSRSIGACGGVNTRRVHNHYTVNINFDFIYGTHKCDAWDEVILLEKIRIEGGLSEDNIGKRGFKGYIQFSNYFNGQILGGKKYTLRVRGIFNFEEERILFFPDERRTPDELHSFNVIIERAEAWPGQENHFSNWNFVDISFRIEDREFAIGSFDDFISD